jgi:hypothetical protein
MEVEAHYPDEASSIAAKVIGKGKASATTRVVGNS